jgi:Predicted permease.
VYEDEAGKKVYLQLAGTIQNSIFQGSILVDKTIFSHIWQEITGSEVLLLKVDEPDVDRSALLLSQALNEYGIRITPTAQRLSEFNRVTDTYLDIFLALGGIGLLLGIMSFIIVVRKDLVSRKEQIVLYRSLGFSDNKIEPMLLSENRLVPLYAIFTGILGSLIGISAGFTNVGIWLWVMVAVLTILFVASVLVFIKKSVRSLLRDTDNLIITE